MHTTMRPEPIRLTYADFCALPEDGRRYEILDGDLFMSPSPGESHQTIVLNIAIFLREHLRRNKLGRVYVAPFDVILDEHNVIEPDVLFVSNANNGIITAQNIQGSPDLLIEVLSPTSVERDTRDKRNLYARCGVKNYWMVDAEERSLTELELIDRAYAVAHVTKGVDVFRPRLFPGLEVQPADLWE